MTQFDTVLVMKNFNRILILVVVLSFTQSAWSQRRRSSGGSSGYGYGSSAPVETTYSSSYGSSSTWSWGLSSAYNLLRTTDTVLSGLFQINDKSAVQGYLYYAKDNSNDKYGLGGIYKYTLSGSATSGLHVGGGLGLGKYTSSFNFMHIVGVIGFHLPIIKNITIHVLSLIHI